MNTDVVNDLIPFGQRYELQRQLPCVGPDRGWQAFDRLLQREVVVNLANEFLADAEAFLNHARLRGRLRHPNLIPIYDMGITEDNLPFFTQPSVDTIDLNQLVSGWEVNDQQLPASLLNVAVGHLLAACHAVEFVHRHGYMFVHLTPGRVAIHESFGEVFVTDAVVDRNLESDELGRIIGNPAYIAPEQLRTSYGPSQANDVYGLGGILYWMLHGTPPNVVTGTRSTLEALKQLAGRSKPPPKRTIRLMFACRSNKRRTTRLQEIALNALEPLPERRTATAAVFLRQLKEWLDDQ